MAHKVNNLNGDFGVIIEGVSREDLCSSEFRQQAHQLWIKNGGLIGLRGIDLNKLTSNELMDWSAHFGDVDHDNFVAREDKKLTVYQYYVSETHGMNREKQFELFQSSCAT